MALARFTSSFTQQPPIPGDRIIASNAGMRSGRFHRHKMEADDETEAIAPEREYAAWQKARYCVAVASSRQTMQIAMRADDFQTGDAVLTNGFTRAPLPGAIAEVGAKPILVEIDDDLVIDIEDLATKVEQSGARALLQPHMRWHPCDKKPLCDLVWSLNPVLIEDCSLMAKHILHTVVMLGPKGAP